MSDSPPVMKLPFEEAPCACVKYHSPKPLEVERHHVFPQSDQIKRYGKVVDKTLVNLCDVAHKNIHVALTKRLKGEDYRLGNHYQQSIVEAGLAKIQGEQ